MRHNQSCGKIDFKQIIYLPYYIGVTFSGNKNAPQRKSWLRLYDILNVITKVIEQ